MPRCRHSRCLSRLAGNSVLCVGSPTWRGFLRAACTAPTRGRAGPASVLASLHTPHHSAKLLHAGGNRRSGAAATGCGRRSNDPCERRLGLRVARARQERTLRNQPHRLGGERLCARGGQLAVVHVPAADPPVSAHAVYVPHLHVVSSLSLVELMARREGKKLGVPYLRRLIRQEKVRPPWAAHAAHPLALAGGSAHV